MKLSGVVPEADVLPMIGAVLSESGSTRIGYAVVGDSDWVIKDSRNALHAANWMEWEVWNDIASSDMARTFAECRAISDTGRYLVMERLTTEMDDLPKPDTPNWLTDRKPNAFGVTRDGVVKVLDYGHVKECAGDSADAPLLPWPKKSETDQMAKWLRPLDADDEPA